MITIKLPVKILLDLSVDVNNDTPDVIGNVTKTSTTYTQKESEVLEAFSKPKRHYKKRKDKTPRIEEKPAERKEKGCSEAYKQQISKASELANKNGTSVSKAFKDLFHRGLSGEGIRIAREECGYTSKRGRKPALFKESDKTGAEVIPRILKCVNCGKRFTHKHAGLRKKWYDEHVETCSVKKSDESKEKFAKEQAYMNKMKEELGPEKHYSEDDEQNYFIPEEEKL